MSEKNNNYLFKSALFLFLALFSSDVLTSLAEIRLLYSNGGNSASTGVSLVISVIYFILGLREYNWDHIISEILNKIP